MASSAGIRAGAAYVEFFGKDGPLLKTMSSLEKRLAIWGKSVTAAGAGVLAAGLSVLGPLTAAAKIFESMGSGMLDMSSRTGASVEALSSLGFAASQSGAAIEDVEVGFKKMSKFAFEAASGSAAANETLQHLGLTIDDIARLAPEDQFRLIASRIAKIQNPTAKAALAMQVFGKSGTSLLPMIQEMGELEQRARDLGLVMSTGDAQAADKLGDAWGELLAVGKAIVFQVGAALAPMLTSLVTKAAETASAVIQWVRANRELLATIFKIAAIVSLVGVGLIILGGLISGLSTVFAVLGSVITFVVGVVGALVGLFTFLTSGVGLVLAAIVGLTVAFFTLTDVGQDALKFIGEAFDNFSKDAVDAWHGIRDAIGNGEIGKAMVVVGKFLSLQWAKIMAFLRQKWADFLNFLVPPLVQVAMKISNIFIDISLNILQTLLDLVDHLQELSGINLIGSKTLDGLKGIAMWGGIGLKAAAGMAITGAGANVTAGANAAAAAALDDADKARTAFHDAVADAKKPGKKFDKEKARMAGVPDLREGLGDMKTAVSGTFSAAAARGLGGASDLAKVANNTDEMKASLKKIADKQPGIGVM